MAGRAYLTQRRDDDGKWAGGFARARTVNRAEDVVDRRRTKLSASDRRRKNALRQSDTREIKDLFDGRADSVSGAVRQHVEYSHPRLARASIKATGRNRKTREEALSSVRGRNRLKGRTVAANPFSGRLIAENRSNTRLGERRASAARAVAARQKPGRAKLAKPAYTGRRRAEP